MRETFVRSLRWENPLEEGMETHSSILAWRIPMDSPWNSPGQSTGVGSLSLVQGIFPTQGSNPGLPHCRQILYQLSHQVSPHTIRFSSVQLSRSVMSDSLKPHGLYSPWNYPGQNTGVGSLSLLQGSFPTQGSNPGLPHCRQILYQLSHKRSP